jgi:AcrR family transcriptional regulator
MTIPATAADTFTHRGAPTGAVESGPAVSAGGSSDITELLRSGYETVCLISERNVSLRRDRSNFSAVPKLWTDTIEDHRQAVRDAALDATGELVANQGLDAVTMTGVAAAAGIGRATLYRYFPDAHSLVVAWHERQIGDHLQQLRTTRDRAPTTRAALEQVLRHYVDNTNHQRTELAVLLHTGNHVQPLRHELTTFLADLLSEGAAQGEVRIDVPAEELAAYCLHALAAANELRSTRAVDRLIAVTLAGLAPDPPAPGSG